jgi:hypothetical protein
MFLGYQNGKIKFYTEEMLNPNFYQLEKQEYTDKEYVLDGDEYILKDETWEEKQAQAEKERIAKLYLTGADVERGIYQAKGMDFDDILAFVMANPPQGLDVKALRIELKANNFYRGNPYVEAVGALLGFTSEQLDCFFETNDYTYLISEPPVNNSEPVDEENSVTDEVIEEEDVNNLEGDVNNEDTNEPTDISI